MYFSNAISSFSEYAGCEPTRIYSNNSILRRHVAEAGQRGDAGAGGPAPAGVDPRGSPALRIVTTDALSIPNFIWDIKFETCASSGEMF